MYKMTWYSLLSHWQKTDSFPSKSFTFWVNIYGDLKNYANKTWRRSYEGFAFYLRCACILALYVRHILSLQVYMARLGMKFFKVITPFGKWNLVDRVRRRGSIFVSVFYQIKLSIGPFSMVYFCLGKVLDDMSASLGVLNQFCWTYSLRVLQDRWIFRSKYKCAWRSNRRCSQLDTQGYPADEWNFNVFA